MIGIAVENINAERASHDLVVVRWRLIEASRMSNRRGPSGEFEVEDHRKADRTVANDPRPTFSLSCVRCSIALRSPDMTVFETRSSLRMLPSFNDVRARLLSGDRI